MRCVRFSLPRAILVFTRILLTISGTLAGVFAFCAPLSAQDTQSDYLRADGFRARTDGKVFKSRVTPHWFAGNTRFWYRNDLVEGEREFVLVDAIQGTRRPAFDHARLAAAMAKATGKPIDGKRLPFDQLDFDAKEPFMLVQFEGKTWRCDLQSYEVRQQNGEVKPPPVSSLPLRQQLSAVDDKPVSGPSMLASPSIAILSEAEPPEGQWDAFFKDHNLCLCDVKTKEEYPLTSDGSAEDEYSGPIWWSPDHKKIVVLRTKKGDERKVYYIESSPKDQLQPKLCTPTATSSRATPSRWPNRSCSTSPAASAFL
jgi:hypothetical protein